MPQLNKGGKIIIFTGSKITGGFCVTRGKRTAVGESISFSGKD